MTNRVLFSSGSILSNCGLYLVWLKHFMMIGVKTFIFCLLLTVLLALLWVVRYDVCLFHFTNGCVTHKIQCDTVTQTPNVFNQTTETRRGCEFRPLQMIQKVFLWVEGYVWSLLAVSAWRQVTRTPSPQCHGSWSHTGPHIANVWLAVKCSQIITWTPLLQILPQTNTATMQT